MSQSVFKPAKESQRHLGTFLGVYTPTILTILGVIMYLRFGWLIGHMGLERSLLIVLFANAITLVTTLSFSAVATNIRLGGGGAYYIISRSLGVEIGGAIGLPLFLSQAFSVTLYAFGLAEALRFVFPGLPIQTTAFLIVAAVGLIAFSSAQLALKIQVPLMIMIFISIAALAIGAFLKFGDQPFTSIAPSGEVGFWVGFAVFFPAVTGVMAGLGLSGDLKEPGRAVPIGSISAVLTGLAVYLLVPFLLFIGAGSEALKNNSLIWTEIAPFGKFLVLPGLFGAIFSSAIGSMLTAPRTLQALARDRIAPAILGKRSSGRLSLLPGFIVTLVISLGAVLLGDLNAVAPVVSMFFLTVYGIINLVAALESLSGDPSWRPRIKIPWPVNLAGAAGCIFAMFLISPMAGGIAILVELCIWIMLSRRERKSRWGDARRGLYESLIRWALIHLSKRAMSPRNWRPHLMVFVSDIERQLDMVRFGYWFSQGRGLVTVCQLLVGDLFDEKRDLRQMRFEMQDIVDREGLVVFAEVDVVSEVVDGIVSVSQANGMAGIESNTVLLGWPDNLERLAAFTRVMRRLEHLNKSFVIGRISPKYIFRRESIKRSIHVWWGGLQRNGDLMLLLAYLLTRNPEWRDVRVQVMSAASNDLMKTQTEKDLKEIIARTRIETDVKVFIKPEDITIRELIQKESKDAEVVFFGLAVPEKGDEKKYAERIEALAGDLQIVFFVKNSSVFTGELLQDDPEDEDLNEEADQ
jgi:amino acid transporter